MNKLNEATNEIDRAKNEIEVIQKKSFSRSGSLAVSRSLEDIQSLHNRLHKIEEKLGFSSHKGNMVDMDDSNIRGILT